MTLRKLCGNKMLLLSLVLVIIWLFLALISPWIVPQDPLLCIWKNAFRQAA